VTRDVTGVWGDGPNYWATDSLLSTGCCCETSTVITVVRLRSDHVDPFGHQ
jgi:hypothetical protein